MSLIRVVKQETVSVYISSTSVCGLLTWVDASQAEVTGGTLQDIEPICLIPPTRHCRQRKTLLKGGWYIKRRKKDGRRGLILGRGRASLGAGITVGSCN